MKDHRKDLIIIGFSGFGKELYWLASRLGITVRGFLDDSPVAANQKYFDAPVLDCVDYWQEYADCEFVIAIGNPRIRKKVHDKMCALGQPAFATLVDPAAIVMHEHVSIGPGSVVCAGTICTVDVSIGAHVIINLNCTIGHETQIGDFATIAPMAAVSGNVRIGHMVEVGTGAAIRQGLTINDGAMVGMGSVLTKNIAERTMFFGNPAKMIKTIAE